MNVNADADSRQEVGHQRSGGEDLVEKSLGLVLVRLLGKRKLAHENLPRLSQHPLLASRQAPLTVPAPQVANYLGDLVDVSGRELLEIGLVPAGPVGRLLRVRGAEHLEYALQPFLPDHVPDANQLSVVGGNTHSQVALVDLEHEVGLILTLDRTGLDLFDPSSPMMGVDDGVADLERHVACTPSAGSMLPRRTGVISRP